MHQYISVYHCAETVSAASETTHQYISKYHRAETVTMESETMRQQQGLAETVATASVALASAAPSNSDS